MAKGAVLPMKSADKEKLLRVVLPLFRSVGLYLFSAFFATCSRVIAIYFNYDSRGQYNFISNRAVCIVSLVISLVFYFSVIRTATLLHNPTRKKFFAVWKGSDQLGFGQKCNFLLRLPETLADLGVTLFFLLLFPTAFGHSSLVFLLGDHGNKGMVLLIMFPTLTLLNLLGKLSALTAWSDDWFRHRRISEPDDVSPLRAFGKLALLCPVFLLGCAVLPPVTAALNALRKILFLVEPLTLVLVFLGLLLLVLTVRFWIAARKRHRFLRNLRALCQQIGYEVCNVRNCYRSILFPFATANFSLIKGNIRYDCRFFSSPNRHSPMLFREEGTVTCTHTLRLFSLVLFSFNLTYDYRFPADGKRILVILPVTYEVFVSGYGTTLLAESGARVADCKIFGGRDFLNALDRDVLGR